MENEAKFTRSLVLSACAVIPLLREQMSREEAETLEYALSELVEATHNPVELTVMASALLAQVALDIEASVPRKTAEIVIRGVLERELKRKPEAMPQDVFQFADGYGILRSIILSHAAASSFGVDSEARIDSALKRVLKPRVLQLGVLERAGLALALYLLALDGFLKAKPELADPKNVDLIVRKFMEDEVQNGVYELASFLKDA